MAKGNCKANVGTRKDPQPCGKPVAKGMLAACDEHKTAMISAPGKDGIYFRGGSYAFVWTHRGRQHKRFFRTLAEAVEFRGDLTRAGGNKRQASKEPLEDYATRWIESYQGRTERGFDEDTRKSYKRALQLYVYPKLGHVPLREIGREDIDDLIASLSKRGLSAQSIEKYLAPLRACLSDAVDRGDILSHPATKLRINSKANGGTPRKREKLMTRAELAAVLREIPDEHKLLFEVLGNTGMRISECLGLDWEDFDAANSTLSIRRQWYRGHMKNYAKSEKGIRTIALGPALKEALWREGADKTGPMFHTRTGTRCNDRNLRRHALDPACKQAGVTISFHSLRHTHGSILLNEGWPITDVADRLGDDVLTVQKSYAHKMQDSARDLPEFGQRLGIEHREAMENEAPAESADSLR